MSQDSQEIFLSYETAQRNRLRRWVSRYRRWILTTVVILCLLFIPDCTRIHDVTETYLCWQCGKHQLRRHWDVNGFFNSDTVAEQQSSLYLLYKDAVDEPHEHDWRYLWVSDRSGTFLARGIACGSDINAEARESRLSDAILTICQDFNQLDLSERRKLFKEWTDPGTVTPIDQLADETRAGR